MFGSLTSSKKTAVMESKQGDVMMEDPIPNKQLRPNQALQ